MSYFSHPYHAFKPGTVLMSRQYDNIHLLVSQDADMHHWIDLTTGAQFSTIRRGHEEYDTIWDLLTENG